MSNHKLQCYVKSIKSDTSDIIESSKPAVLYCIAIVLASLITIAVGWFLFVGLDQLVLILKPFVDMVVPFFTQYKTYIILMILLDIFILYAVYLWSKSNDTDINNVSVQVVVSSMLLFSLWIVNAIILSSQNYSTKPEIFYGWSYVVWESIINFVIITIGVFLIRAYVRCEGKEVTE